MSIRCDFECSTCVRAILSPRSATWFLYIGLLPLAFSSLGPLPNTRFAIRATGYNHQSPTLSKLHASAKDNCNSIAIRGGHADYIGDDEWDKGQPDQMTEPQSNPQSHPQPTENPYGPGAPWQQQSNRQSYPSNQSSWGGHEAQSQQMNSQGSFGQQLTNRNEPQLPDSQRMPIYRGSPQQQYQMQHGHPGQSVPHPQQHPQGQYPPPPQMPGYGRPGTHGNQIPPSHPSSNAYDTHTVSQDMRSSGYEDEEEDDWLPVGDNVREDSGIQLPAKGHEGTSDAGGMDLSQFDKDLIFSGLKRLYRKKIRPLELSSKYGHFHSPPLSPSDFDAKPMVLLVGQYSVGKTSFIRYLLGRDFPGQRIGPEPTTDRFVAIIKGESGDKVIPGAALCSQADRPFRGLSPFGNNFLSRFEGVEMDSPILNNITLVDTPGILSGQKQMIGRNYDYEQVMKWFAERADLIIIMFDAHKLDISDELKRVIELFKPHQDKMRVLLNKADSISTQQLMRVYGALMWSLGKVMMTPEVCRVYMGSFWGAPLKNKEQASLLTQEKMDLFNDIAQLPQNAVMRRINELVKRARSVKVHAYIIHYLRKQLPYTWGKREKQRRLIDRLDREFIMCARRYELPRGDFPELEPFRQALLEIKDLSEVHKLDKKMVKEMDKVFSIDIPNLLEAAKVH